MKRILSFLLIFATILALAVPVFAVTGNVVYDETYTVNNAWVLNLDLDLTPFREGWIEQVHFWYQDEEYFHLDFAYASDRSYWLKIGDGSSIQKNLYHSQYDGWKPNSNLDNYRIIEFNHAQTVSLKFYNWLLANAIPLQEYGSYVKTDYYLDGSFGMDDFYWYSPSSFGLIPSDLDYYDIQLDFTDAAGRRYYGMRISDNNIKLHCYPWGENMYVMWDDQKGLYGERYNQLTFTYGQYVSEAFFNWFSVNFVPDGIGSADDCCLCISSVSYDFDLNGYCDYCKLLLPSSISRTYSPEGWPDGYPLPPLGAHRKFTYVSSQFFVIREGTDTFLYFYYPEYDSPTRWDFICDDSNQVYLDTYDLGVSGGIDSISLNRFVYKLIGSEWFFLDTDRVSSTSFGDFDNIQIVFSTLTLQFLSSDSGTGGILGWLKSIWDSISSLPDLISRGISKILKEIFVPDLDRLQNKFTDFMSGLNSNAYGRDDGLPYEGPLLGGHKETVDTMGGIMDTEAEEPLNIDGSLSIGELHWDKVTWLDLGWFKEGIRYFRWIINLWIYWLLAIFCCNQCLSLIGQFGSIGSSVAKTVDVAIRGHKYDKVDGG